MPQDARTSRRTRLTAAGVMLLIGVAAILGFLAGRAPLDAVSDGTTETAATAKSVSDVASFVAALSGDWQGPQEHLLIKNDKGVIEILRQTRLGTGEIQLDQFVAAPVQFEPARRRLELETPEGPWLLTLIPGARRAQLSITYPDQRHVLYQ